MPKKELQAFQLNALLNATVIDLKQRRIVNAASSVNIYDYVNRLELQNLGIEFGVIGSGAGIQAISVNTAPDTTGARLVINSSGLQIFDTHNNVRTNFTLTDATTISDIAGNNKIICSSAFFVTIVATDATPVIQFTKTITNLLSGKFQINGADVLSAAGQLVGAGGVNSTGIINTSQKYQIGAVDVITSTSAFVGIGGISTMGAINTALEFLIGGAAVIDTTSQFVGSGGVNVGGAAISTSGTISGGTVVTIAMSFNGQSVSKGAANSGGTGFAVLRVPN